MNRTRHQAFIVRRHGVLRGCLALLLLGVSSNVPGAERPIDAGGALCKRQDVFEFAKPPTFQRVGRDRYEIRFTSKGYCDVTVGIVNAEGRIIRHLAAGVLGANAPEPLLKDRLDQQLIWDGKNDLERYIEAPDTCRLRVTLGLKPVFDKVVFYHPNRIGWAVYGLASDEQGVYVFSTEGNPTMTYAHGPPDQTRIALYDHDGNYVRTLLPPARDKVAPGGYVPSPMAGQGQPAWRQPVPKGRLGPPYGLVLPDGTTVISATMEGDYFLPLEANAFDVHDGVITGVVCPDANARKPLQFFRLKTDGSMPVKGFYGGELGDRRGRGPCWVATSPDGKWVYLSGLGARMRTLFGKERDNWIYSERNRRDVADHAVYRLPADLQDGFTEPFLGVKGEAGTDAAHFNYPEGVRCDREGRIYVSDRGNDRVQVFQPDGKLLKSIPVPAPYQVDFNPKTGAIYVLSYSEPYGKLTLLKLKDLGEPTVQARETLDVPTFALKLLPTFCVDVRAAEPTVWLTGADFHVQLWVDKGDRFELKRDLHADFERQWKGALVEVLNVGNLAADPWRPHLYVGNTRDGGPILQFRHDMKSPRIQTETGEVELSRGATVVGYDGLVYLREGNEVVRYNPETGEPVAFDYGDGEEGRLWYQYSSADGTGIGVSPWGDVVYHDRWPPVPGFSTTNNENVGENRLRLPNYMRPKLWRLGDSTAASLEHYRLRNFYPGRVYGASGAVLIYDRSGQLKTNDAVEAVPRPVAGVRMDLKGNLYVGVAYPKVVDGKEMMGNSLVKFPPAGGRFIVNGRGVRFPLEDEPKRPPDFVPDLSTNAHGAPDDKGPDGETGYGTRAWAEGMLWSFGGYYPFSRGHCICVNARFDLDFFGRSFVPESHRQSVSVLDAGGNFILRLGSYGNEDDRGPQIHFGHCRYVAVNDHRLYLNDVTNRRILSIDLKYEKTAEAELK